MSEPSEPLARWIGNYILDSRAAGRRPSRRRSLRVGPLLLYLWDRGYMRRPTPAMSRESRGHEASSYGIRFNNRRRSGLQAETKNQSGEA